MAVIRRNKNNNYTAMSNAHLKDDGLSLKAKGLLSMVLSLPDEWIYSINGLAKICKESTTAIRSTIKELEEHGYLKRTRKQNDKGLFEYEYLFFEEPIECEHMEELIEEEPKKEEPIEEKPYIKEPYIGNGHTENVRQLNTKESITKESITNKSNTKYKGVLQDYTSDFDLFDALNGFVEMRKKMKGFTIRALELALMKLDKLGTTTEEKIAIVNQSVMNGWKAFYPLKDKQYPQQQKTKKGDGSEYAEFD